MTTLHDEAVALRTAIKANPRLELELKGRFSEILRAYHVGVSPRLLSDLVFAVEHELLLKQRLARCRRRHFLPLAEQRLAHCRRRRYLRSKA